jgi:hypothetical protein
MLNSTGARALLKDIKTKHEEKQGKMKKGEKLTYKLIPIL